MLEREADTAMMPRSQGRRNEVFEICNLLVCPGCRGSLCWSSDDVRCEVCARAYPVVDGIPVLLLDQSAAEHDELEHLHAHGYGHSHDHKQQQAAYFDHEEAAEFEIARPHGTPDVQGCAG